MTNKVPIPSDPVQWGPKLRELDIDGSLRAPNGEYQRIRNAVGNESRGGAMKFRVRRVVEPQNEGLVQAYYDAVTNGREWRRGGLREFVRVWRLR